MDQRVFMVRDHRSVRPVAVADVLYLYSHYGVTTLRTAEGKEYRQGRNMKAAFGGLAGTEGFCRVHQSWAVHLVWMKEYRMDKHVAVLKCGTEVSVSRRYRKGFLRDFIRFTHTHTAIRRKSIILTDL